MKNRQPLLASLFLISIIFTPICFAEVYKWVDENGNVHFSDNPQDADKGEQVNYGHLNVLEGGEELAASASKNRKRVSEQQAKASETNTESSVDPCRADLENYQKYSTVHHDANGVPFYYYLNDEDGRPMSQRDHNEMVSKMKAELERRGCL